jgi:hypothetical protein
MENVEIEGSQHRMGLEPLVLKVIADWLAAQQANGVAPNIERFRRLAAFLFCSLHMTVRFSLHAVQRFGLASDV